MASGLEMFEALKEKTNGIARGGVFSINPDDKADLCKLTRADLAAIGFDDATAMRVAGDLKKGNLIELGNALGLSFQLERYRLNLIPGEGGRRAAEILKDDPQTLDEMLEEMAAMRHGGGRN